MHYLTYHESRVHGTVEFPAQYYYTTPEHPRYHMTFHWHKEWEIIRILKGEFLLRVDDEEYVGHAGDFFLIRDGMLHGGTPKDCIYECFVFDLHGLFRDVSAVKKYLRPIYRNAVLPQVYYPDHYKPLYSVVDELLNAFSQVIGNQMPQTALSAALKMTDPQQASLSELLPESSGKITQENPSELFALGNLSRLFAFILQNQFYTLQADTPTDSSRKVTQVKPVLEYIESHFAEEISLDDLSSAVGMSSKYFCRFFHSITHQTPMDYVNSYRIEQAALLLASTDIPITQVGLECGFHDSSYFTKVFRRYKKVTPRQYRGS